MNPSFDLRKAHKHCGRNRDELLASREAGCFHCLKVFDPNDIAEWTDGNATAICPRCGIDSVLGDASGYPMTASFLEEMNAYWFQPVDHDQTQADSGS